MDIKLKDSSLFIVILIFFSLVYNLDSILKDYPNFQFYLYLTLTLATSPFYLYLMYKTINHYSIYFDNIYKNVPIKLTISLIGPLVYLLVCSVTAKKIQIIFNMPAAYFPSTSAFLNFILTLSIWIFLVGIILYVIYIYLVVSKKEFKLRVLGVHIISLLLICFGWGCLNKFVINDSIIKKLAINLDYVDINFLSLTCKNINPNSKILFLDSNNISIANNDHLTKQIKFKTSKC